MTAPSVRLPFDHAAGDQTGVGTVFSDNDNTDDGTVSIVREGGNKITESQLPLVDDEGSRASRNNCATYDLTEIKDGDQAAPQIDAEDIMRLVWVSENNADDTSVVVTVEGSDD